MLILRQQSDLDQRDAELRRIMDAVEQRGLPATKFAMQQRIDAAREPRPSPGGGMNRIVRLDELDSDTRRLVLALINAGRGHKEAMAAHADHPDAVGFDVDHLPVLLWTRDMQAIPRIGDEINALHNESNVTVVIEVTAVTWLEPGERWDVAVWGTVTRAYDENDLSLEEFAQRLAVPKASGPVIQ